MTGGVKPPLVPYVVCLTTDAVSETSTVTADAVALPAPPAPAGGAPGVQPAKNAQIANVRSRIERIVAGGCESAMNPDALRL